MMRWQVLIALGMTGRTVVIAQRNDISSQALSIPPSEFWDGNDGQWSTFLIQIGTPGQLIRVLPDTSASAGDVIWAVLPEGCSQANPQLPADECASSRGKTFDRNASTTWSTSRLANNGLYGLPTVEESILGLGNDGNAFYGFDTVMLGTTGSGLPVLPAQLVLGYATNAFWIGFLGLSPLPFNFTSSNEPIPSVLGHLRNTSVIPSSTWAYTAGAVYKTPSVFGGLTLGGLDEERLQGEGISVPFWTDQSRDLLIGLQSITYNTLGSSPLLTNGIYTFIDSMVTHLWLPLEACQAFEAAFNLVWNETAELYLLNSSTHAQLLAQSPVFAFTLGASDSGGNTTTITLPYAAFDVNMTTADGSTWYFPLKRAQNSSQYTLGRVFLQEAYVIADYDRQNFTVAQAAFPTRGQQELKAIFPPGFTTTTNHVLGAGAIAGIAVGAVVVIALIVLALWLLRRRRRHEGKPRAGAQDYQDEKKEKHDSAIGAQEAEGSFRNYSPELPQDAGRVELHSPDLPGQEERAELHVADTYGRAELYASDQMNALGIQELAADDVAAAELSSHKR